jgi:Fe2+ or Zn2+ uptake regulation protein
MTLQSMIDYTKFVCEACNNEDEECQECCPHDEHDHGHCLCCGKDRTEALAGAAEYAFEGDR